MSKKFLTNVDLGGNQLLNGRLHNNSSDPTPLGASAGQIYYNTSTGVIKYFNGTASAWQTLTAGGAVSSVNGFSGTVNIIGTANHISVTNSGSVILDLDPSVVFTASVQTLTGKTLSSGSLSGTTTNSSSISGGSATSIVIGSSSLVGAIVSTASISGGSATSLVIGSSSLTGPITGTGATVTGGTFSGVTLSGTTTNSSSISGGSATSLVIGTASLVGTLTSTASINGGSVGGITLGNTTLSGSISGGSVTGTVHNSGSLTGTIVNSASIGGGTLNPTTFQINGVGATSANTNSAPMIRDAAGRAQVTDPSAAQDIATKNYVDGVAQGLNTRAAVGYATTGVLANGVYTAGAADQSGGTGIGATITASVNGTLSVDGSTLTVNDRVLVKNQTTQTQNGIYYVSASGSGAAPWVLTRAADADNSESGELGYGDYWFVQNGTANANTGWVQTTKGTGTGVANGIKIGTDNVVFAQFMQAAAYTGASGVNVAGTVISFSPSANGGLQTSVSGAAILRPANSGLVIDSTGLYIGVGTGLAISGTTLSFGSGSTANSGQVSNAPYTYATQKQYATITGDNATTSFTINHNLGTRDVTVQVYQTSAGPDTQYAEVEVDIVRATTSTVTVGFAVAPAGTSTYNAVIVG